MSEFIFWLLRAGFWGLLASLTVWGICSVLRRFHTPSRWLCWLWLSAAIRFVWPQGIRITVPKPQNESLVHLNHTVLRGSSTLAAPSGTAASVSGTAGLHWMPVLFAVWAAGAVLLAARALWGYARLRRSVAAACQGPDGCYGGVTTPFTLGILRPRIFLPDTLTGEARAAVLLHEQTHIRRGDTLTKPLFYAVACLHWFNPVVWFAFRQFERCMEDACDEAAIQGKTIRQRAAYGETLLQFAVQGGAAPGSLSLGQGIVRRRVLHLLCYRQPGRFALAVCAAVVGVCVTACMVRPSPEPAPDAGSASAEIAAPEAAIAPESGGAPEPSPAAPVSAEQALVQMSGYLSFPVPDYTLISKRMGEGHRGDDIAAEYGSDVLAAADGIVTAADYQNSMGYYVEILHGEGGDGAEWSTLYAHLAEAPLVETGQSVHRGQSIGKVGNTGFSTGNHLHFEVRHSSQPLPPSCFTQEPDGTAPLPLTEEQAAALLVGENFE